MDVLFNSRSYLLTEESGKCASQSFGDGDYSCVDYKAGALYLAGKTLSFSIDLSGAGCGCNAAIYLVSMPQNSNKSKCNDFYCDANSVCGIECAEIDLVEANKVAFVSTVHVADDADGDGFGIGHYVIPKEKRIKSADSCPYGPSAACTIDTNYPFTASFIFSPAGTAFHFNVSLTQGDKSAGYGPVKYSRAPTKGKVDTIEEANANLRLRIDSGMTLVASHWSGTHKKDMGWLDAPCTPIEISGWECTDAFVENPSWPWLCSSEVDDPPSCAATFTVKDLSVHNPPPAPSAQATPTALLHIAHRVPVSMRIAGIVVGLTLVIIGGICAGLAFHSLGRIMVFRASAFSALDTVPTLQMPRADDLSDDGMTPRRHNQSEDSPAPSHKELEVHLTVPEATSRPLDVETASGARVHVPLTGEVQAGDQITFSMPMQSLAGLSAADIDDLREGRITVHLSREEVDTSATTDNLTEL
jgi:hypothetical protein